MSEALAPVDGTRVDARRTCQARRRAGERGGAGQHIEDGHASAQVNSALT